MLSCREHSRRKDYFRFPHVMRGEEEALRVGLCGSKLARNTLRGAAVGETDGNLPCRLTTQSSLPKFAKCVRSHMRPFLFSTCVEEERVLNRTLFILRIAVNNTVRTNLCHAPKNGTCPKGVNLLQRPRAAERQTRWFFFSILLDIFTLLSFLPDLVLAR